MSISQILPASEWFWNQWEYTILLDTKVLKLYNFSFEHVYLNAHNIC